MSHTKRKHTRAGGNNRRDERLALIRRRDRALKKHAVTRDEAIMIDEIAAALTETE
jgi:hypothetical protein